MHLREEILKEENPHERSDMFVKEEEDNGSLTRLDSTKW